MGDVGLWEVLVIAVVGLVVFGPERLPEVARKAARLLASLRHQASSAMEELRQAADLDDLERDVKEVSADLRRMRDVARNPMRAAVTAATTPRPADEQPPVDLEAT
jgi:sec-independent protein translocase protein TatB